MEIHKLPPKERKDLYDAAYAEVLKEFRDNGGIWMGWDGKDSWSEFKNRVKKLQEKYDV